MSALRVRFLSSYMGVSDFACSESSRVHAAWDHETCTYFVADQLGFDVVAEYEAAQRVEWDRWVAGKSDRESFGPYPTRHVVIDAAEWTRRVYPNAVPA